MCHKNESKQLRYNGSYLDIVMVHSVSKNKQKQELIFAKPQLETLL